MTTNLNATASLQALRSQMHSAFIGRDAEIDGMLTALIAKTHCLLLGPPGTAKSLLTQTLASALQDQPEDYFQLLLTSFTTPDEVFGGPDLPALDRGEGLRRDVQGYLPTARTAFLDEIFKANSAILNALLTMLNERSFDNGGKRMNCPLQLCVGASNEYPEDSSLEALYDRFQLRFWTDYLPSRSERKRLLLCPDPASQVTTKLTGAQVSELQNLCRNVKVPDNVLEALLDVAERLAQLDGLQVSDRRLRSAVKLLQARAVLNGRDHVQLPDLQILADSLWHRHEQRPSVLAVVLEVAAPGLAKAQQLADAATEVLEQLGAKPDMSALEMASKKIRHIETELRGLEIGEQERDDVDALHAEIKAVRKAVARRFAQLNPAISSVLRG